MKTITKIMTNEEIYQLATNLIRNFNNNETYMPAAVAFSIQKNKTSLLTIAEEIERLKIVIFERYGKKQEDGNYIIPQEKIDEANKELSDLLSIEHEMKVYTFELEQIEKISFTPAQMQAIIFMINED